MTLYSGRQEIQPLQKNHSSHPFLLALLVVAALLALSFAPNAILAINPSLKPVDILSDIRPKPANDNSAVTAAALPVERKPSPSTSASLFASSPESTGAMLARSASTFIPKGNAAGESESSSGFLTDFGGSQTPALSQFYKALRNDTGRSKVRVAYYGDSQIEGDLVCMDLREMLQKRFGGKGPGFLRITSIDAPYRTVPKHTFSGKWKNSILGAKRSTSANFGISGAFSIPSPGSSVKYQFSSDKQRVADVSLYYGDALDGAKVKYSVNAGTEGELPLESGNGVKTVRIPYSPEEAVGILKLVPLSSSMTLYGVSFDDGNGVYVDNFPLRGNSGLNLNSISPEILKGFSAHLKYRLIVLQFGINVAAQGQKNFGWYEKGMGEIVAHFKKAFPESSILLVSVGDKSVNTGNGYRTDTCIPHLVEAQKRIAREHRIAFFDMYRAMGGENSMVSWVQRGIAGKDYTHFGAHGGKLIARKMFSSMMEQYEAGR